MWKRAYRETTKRNARIQRNACTHRHIYTHTAGRAAAVGVGGSIHYAGGSEMRGGSWRKGTREDGKEGGGIVKVVDTLDLYLHNAQPGKSRGRVRDFLA